jgi:hypothetical protein
MTPAAALGVREISRELGGALKARYQGATCFESTVAHHISAVDLRNPLASKTFHRYAGLAPATAARRSSRPRSIDRTYSRGQLRLPNERVSFWRVARKEGFPEGR